MNFRLRTLDEGRRRPAVSVFVRIWKVFGLTQNARAFVP
jgi:hypothetical protein